MRTVLWMAIVSVTLMVAVPRPAEAGGYRGHRGKYINAYHHGWKGHYGRWRGHRTYWGPRARWDFRFYWGGPVVVGPPFYPYGYCAPPPVIIRRTPPVYVEPERQKDAYWYYCESPKGFYPYVKSCPDGWMKVVPQPTPPDP